MSRLRRGVVGNVVTLQDSQKMRITHVSVKRIVNNTVISLAGQAISWASTLLLTIAYGRFLGPEKFGELYFAITFVGLIGVPLEFGFNAQLTRGAAQEPGKALGYLWNTLLLKTVLWLILFSVILLICWLLGYSLEVWSLVAICGVTLLSGSIASTFASLFCGFEGNVYPVIGNILNNALSALAGILILRAGAGVQTMAFVLLGGSLSSVIWQAICFFRLVGTGFNIDMTLIRNLVRTSIPFLTYGAIGVIYYRIDTVLLSLMTNDTVVGWYGAGYRLFDTLVFLPGLVISAIMYPVYAKLSVSSERDLKVAIEKSLNFLLICGIPIATLLLVAAPDIIQFLYNRVEFYHAIPVLQCLSFGLVFLYINSVFTTLLMSTKREKKITIMAMIALVFNLGLNLILIRLYQQVGAAIVTSLTEILLFCVSILFIPRQLLPLGSLPVAFKIIIASCVMALVIIPLRSILPLREFNIFVILFVGTLIYCVVATLLRTIPKGDILALYRGVRHKAQTTNPSPDENQLEIEQSSQALETEGEPQAAQEAIWPAGNAMKHMLDCSSTIYYQLDEDSEITEKRPRIKYNENSSSEVLN